MTFSLGKIQTRKLLETQRTSKPGNVFIEGGVRLSVLDHSKYKQRNSSTNPY